MRALRSSVGRLSAASVAPMADFSLRFLRTVVLSHLLMPRQLGAAIAVSVVFATGQILSDLGIDRFVMLHAGDSGPQALAACNRLSMIRQLLLGGIIFLFAPWIAAIAGAPDSVIAIRWLAVAHLVWAPRSWILIQIQGEGRFAPEAIAQVAAQSAALTAAVVGAVWLGDERAMAISIAVYGVLYTILSQCLVSVRRVTAVDPEMRRAALRYGIPLMANGLGIIVLSQLDRYMVSNLFGLEQLAVYALALNLALLPISPLLSTTSSLGIVFLRQRIFEPRAALIMARGIMLLAATYAIGVGALLDCMVPVLYGQNYRVTPLFALLATLVAFVRLCRQGPNIVLMAQSATGRVALTTLIGGLGLASGLGLTLYTGRLEAVLFGLLIGDFLTLAGLLRFSGRFLPLPKLLPNLAWLLPPVALAAFGPLAADVFGVKLRLCLLAGAFLLLGIEGVKAFGVWKRGLYVKQQPVLPSTVGLG